MMRFTFSYLGLVEFQSRPWKVINTKLLILISRVKSEILVLGIRAPFLQGGGDDQFAMMKEHGFLYDCSMPTLKYGYLNQNQSVWPYTLDYKNSMDCQIEPCPQCSFPGIWVQPMSTLRDNRANECGPDGCPCSMLDSCQWVLFLLIFWRQLRMIQLNF